jgi:anti-sigma B factor antagonist
MPSEPPELSLQTTSAGAVTTIVLAGEIDLYTVPRADLEFKRVLAGQPAPAAVRVDLRAVTFMDSTGLSSLLAARRRAISVGSRLNITAMSPTIARLFEIAGMDTLLTESADP